MRLFAVKHERIHRSITKLKGKISAQGQPLMDYSDPDYTIEPPNATRPVRSLL